MAILSVKPETVHRDWDDVTKFRGNPFTAYEYEAPEESQAYDVIHRVEFAQPAANGAAGSPLDPVTLYLAVKNYGPHPVLLYLQNNLHMDAVEVSIPVGAWVEYVDLNPTTQPRIRVDDTLYSTPSECEILECGYSVWEEDEPEFECDAWAVGHIVQDGTGAKHWPEPVTWANVGTGILDPDHWFADVAGTAVTYYWAVGYETDAGMPSAGLFAQWDGAAWTECDVESDPPMYGVWGYEAAYYWAVGGLLVGEIWNWNGLAWNQDFVEQLEGPVFRAVHGPSASDTWAVGDVAIGGALIYHHDGVTWTASPNTIPCNLYGVWAFDATNVWVVGGNQAWWGASGGTGCCYRLVGGVWTVQILPPGCNCLRAIWGFATNDIWAVGDQGQIVHWDGFVWSVVVEPDSLLGNYDYRGVFGCKPYHVWAIGTDQIGGNVIIVWDGANWTIDHGPNAGEMDLLGLKGVEVAV